jgi:hypothetical protein
VSNNDAAPRKLNGARKAILITWAILGVVCLGLFLAILF